MNKIANRVKTFFHKHFVKHEVHWVQSTLIVHYELDGRKILQIARTSNDGVVEQKNYQIEHLLDENLQVTEQTLEMEHRMFRKPNVME